MTYQAALRILYGLQKHGIKLGLEVVQALLRQLGEPQRRYPTLHIGGTNGKGSTAAMAASVLQAAGHRVGLYTSPHLVDFRERIRVDGVPIPERRLAGLTDRLQQLEGVTEATFFEFTTVMAFQYFAESHVDVAVIEVGMGGRFDATNVLHPLVTTITNVALDHREFLGDTVAAIAAEKAGIIKRGVPLVLGRLDAEAEAVIASVASAQAAPRHALGRDFLVTGEPLAGFRYDGLHRRYEGLTCPLRGRHQLENAGCALAMLELADTQGVTISEAAIRRGLGAVQWEGRLEIVEGPPLLLLDGAHNPAAADVLAAHLRGYRNQHRDARLIFVIGMMRDKDQAEFFRVLAPLADEWVLTQVQLPRAAPVNMLQEALGAVPQPVHIALAPPDAVALARRRASVSDLICVTGSLILVGEIKAMLQGCGVSPIRG